MTRYLETDEIICALATPPGRGGLAVIRMSGPGSLEVAKHICPFLKNTVESHKVYYGHLVDGDSREVLDEALVTFFEEGRSFTSQETLEFSIHGSPAVADMVLQALIRAGARMAEPGEFTYRAYSSGRIDLVQAESVLNLIESKTSHAARVALQQLKGDLSTQLKVIEDELTLTLAHLEASLDFTHEDIETEDNSASLARFEKCRIGIEILVRSYESGRIVKEGLSVALVGAPNVGKSSLLNSLVQFDRALVSAVPGTTRDFVEAELLVSGNIVRLIDTAGLRESSDEIENLGMDRSRKMIEEADLVCYVLDQSQSTAPNNDLIKGVSGDRLVYLINKTDLENKLGSLDFESPTIRVSAKTRDGLEEFKKYIEKKFFARSGEESSVLLNARHFELLTNALKHISNGIENQKRNASPEFIIADVQSALINVYEVLGQRFDDQVMDRVFSEFCLGK